MFAGSEFDDSGRSSPEIDDGEAVTPPPSCTWFLNWRWQGVAAANLGTEIKLRNFAEQDVDFENMSQFWAYHRGKDMRKIESTYCSDDPVPKGMSNDELRPYRPDEDLCPFNDEAASNVEVAPHGKRKGKVCTFRMKKGVTMDSGAGDNVMPKRMINRRKIRASEGSRRGLKYVAATGDKIPNEGEIDFEFVTNEGHQESWVLQVANVNKPLGSVASRVDASCRVVYDKDMKTGKDLSYILHKPSGRIAKMRRQGNVWILDAVVNADMISPELFSRRG